MTEDKFREWIENLAQDDIEHVIAKRDLGLELAAHPAMPAKFAALARELANAAQRRLTGDEVTLAFNKEIGLH